MSARHLGNYYRQFQLAGQLPTLLAAFLELLAIFLQAIFANIWPFGGHFGAIWVHFWGLLGPLGGHFGTVLAPLGKEKGPTSPKTAQIGQKMGPERLPGSVLGGSWGQLGPIRGVWGPFGGDPGAILGPLWGHLGAMCGHFWAAETICCRKSRQAENVKNMVCFCTF